jgi:RNA polymerase sigma-70 factor (ECF subfamily)
MREQDNSLDLVSTNSGAEVAEIVRRILAGDSAAEDEVVRRYRHGVTVIIDHIVRRESATEDVSQETFKLVLEKLRRGDLREPERLSGFVCSVARNVALDYIRRATRFRNREEVGNAEHIPDPAPSQLEEILKQEKAGVVRQIINELKIERDRLLLFRYYIAEEDKDKLCLDLGLTRTQFNNVIYRALLRFKELYMHKVGEP